MVSGMRCHQFSCYFTANINYYIDVLQGGFLRVEEVLVYDMSFNLIGEPKCSKIFVWSNFMV